MREAARRFVILWWSHHTTSHHTTSRSSTSNLSLTHFRDRPAQNIATDLVVDLSDVLHDFNLYRLNSAGHFIQPRALKKLFKGKYVLNL